MSTSYPPPEARRKLGLRPRYLVGAMIVTWFVGVQGLTMGLHVASYLRHGNPAVVEVTTHTPPLSRRRRRLHPRWATCPTSPSRSPPPRSSPASSWSPVARDGRPPRARPRAPDHLCPRRLRLPPSTTPSPATSGGRVRRLCPRRHGDRRRRGRSLRRLRLVVGAHRLRDRSRRDDGIRRVRAHRERTKAFFAAVARATERAEKTRERRQPARRRRDSPPRSASPRGSRQPDRRRQVVERPSSVVKELVERHRRRLAAGSDIDIEQGGLGMKSASTAVG